MEKERKFKVGNLVYIPGYSKDSPWSLGLILTINNSDPNQQAPYLVCWMSHPKKASYLENEQNLQYYEI